MAKTGFAKIETKTKYSMIIDQIMELIQNGAYKPGDKLPNERQMAEALGVSRGALRESLKALIILGIVESHQGNGTYVSRKQASPEGRFGILGNADIDEIIGLRQVIELGCAAEKLEEVTIDDIDTLEKCLEKMKAAGEKGNYKGYLKASQEFHSDLSKILMKRKNKPLENLMEYLWKETNLAISRDIHEDYSGGRIPEHLLSHKNIIEGLKSKSFHQFSSAIRKHYQSILDQLR